MKIPNTDEDYGEFVFFPNNPGTFLYKSAEGELRVPSLVTPQRNLAAQKGISRGTGEHAGHLIATRFGAPGDERNLGLQNPNMNTYAPTDLQERFKGHGASYLEMENIWANALEHGVRIKVKVTEHFQQQEVAGETRRGFYRKVAFSVMNPGQRAWIAMPERFFGNFWSPQAELASAKK